MLNNHLTDKPNSGMRLNIELGSQLIVEPHKITMPLKAILAGLEPQIYLILKIALPKEFKKNLEKGDKLNIKYLSLGTEYGFSAEIIDSIDEPFRLCFISYPDSVVSLDPRARTRVCCYIPASANLNKKQIKGTITDISTNGCRFVIKLPVNLQPKQVMLIDDINFSFPVMGLKGLQTFNGNVKNTSIDKEKIAMGIEFTDLNKEMLRSISDYVTSVSEINARNTIKL